MPLTRNEPRTFELGHRTEIALAANAVVFEGAAIGNNGSGFARPLVAGDAFLGFALDPVSNAGGAAGAKTVVCEFFGAIQLPVTGLVQASIGQSVYASDDGTFTMTAAGNSLIGKVQRFLVNGFGIVRLAT